MTLGQRIQAILQERRVKQVQFAKSLGISANYVNLLVNDKKLVISDTLAKLIEETYGYSAEWVMHGVGDKEISGGLTAAKNETIRKIQKMSDAEVKAVLAFMESLENVKQTYRNEEADS